MSLDLLPPENVSTLRVDADTDVRATVAHAVAEDHPDMVVLEVLDPDSAPRRGLLQDLATELVPFGHRLCVRCSPSLAVVYRGLRPLELAPLSVR